MAPLVELTPALRYLRIALIAWPLLELFGAFLPNVSLPRVLLIAVVQSLIVWGCYRAIVGGSRTARVLLTVIASVQILSGIWQIGFYMTDALGLAIDLISISLRGAVISLANDKGIRAIQPALLPTVPAPGSALPGHEHDWLAHRLLDGWIRCTTCGQVQAKAGEIALIDRKES